MKVLLINGKNQKGSTYHIGKMLASRLGTKKEIQEIFLPRDMPEFCCGCTQCFMKNEARCPHFHYMEPITKAIDDADVLILTSPVYVFHVTAPMKALLDHYGYRFMIHRPEERMFSKQAVCISTAAGGGMKSTCKDMKDSLFFWGIGKIYSYGTAVAATSWNRVKDNKKAAIEAKVNRLAYKIKKKEGKVHPSLKTKIFFNIMRAVHKRGMNPADSVYWQEKGWTGKKRPWKK